MKTKQMILLAVAGLLLTGTGCAGGSAAKLIQAAAQDHSPATLRISSVWVNIVYQRGGGATNTTVEINDSGLKQDSK